MEKSFRIVRAKPSQIRMVWKDDSGKILHSIANAVRQLEKKGEQVTAIMNGGIFEPGCIPSGLYVEGGKMMCPLNLKEGQGNFFLRAPPETCFRLENGFRFFQVEAPEKPVE